MEANKEMTQEQVLSFAAGVAAQEDSPICTAREGVDYGQFQQASYASSFCGMTRRYSILLPASYENKPEKAYPVLYLLHGIFGNEMVFAGNPQNRLRELIRNMILDGLTQEFILVCPNIFAAKTPDAQPGFNLEGTLPYDDFLYDLTGDLMPHIEKTYRVLPGRENTYLAGFSMGGRETLFITTQRPELFRCTCAIAPAPGLIPAKDWAMEHQGQMKEEELHLKEGAIAPDAVLLCCGTDDHVVGQFPAEYHKVMEQNGMAHIWFEVDGADHDDRAIRTGLYRLLELMK